jgi:hypothetical protein
MERFVNINSEVPANAFILAGHNLHAMNVHHTFQSTLDTQVTDTLTTEVTVGLSSFGGLLVTMLAYGTQDCGFKPGRAIGHFGRKNPQHAFLQRGSKAICPLSQLCGRLKNPTMTWKSHLLG